VLLYRAASGWWIETATGFGIPIPATKSLTTREDLFDYLETVRDTGASEPLPQQFQAPLEEQEVWAAGVTYYRSRAARIAESESAGGGDFYDRVYSADRPELFFKATPHRVVGSGADVRIRRDSNWNVPEPEMALLISPGGKIVGYTAANDMSSRELEGANPLYLPQAKTYDKCCALGPGILIQRDPLLPSTGIRMKIRRGAEAVFEGSTTLSEMKRRPEELVGFLFRESSFPQGCFLLTGTGIVPPESFTLAPGDCIEIAIDGIGVLTNTVETPQ
jgi:2-dehydro-3-deoxy-D-arabinonate dehydratase